jgi:hypothetical protein
VRPAARARALHQKLPEPPAPPEADEDEPEALFWFEIAVEFNNCKLGGRQAAIGTRKTY